MIFAILPHKTEKHNSISLPSAIEEDMTANIEILPEERLAVGSVRGKY